MRNREAIITLILAGVISVSMANLAWQEHLTIKGQQTKISQMQKLNVKQNKQLVSLQKQSKDMDSKLKGMQTAIQMTAQNDAWHSESGIATAYSPLDNKNGIEAGSTPNTTSIGLHPGEGIIAVDPSKIPYHSQILVVYPDGHVYSGIAGDTGSALRMSRGMHIDIYKDTYSETEEHGVQKVLIFWKPGKTTD